MATKDSLRNLFTQTDPLEADIGTPYPSSYSYGNNNPVVFTDPSGMRGQVAGSRNPVAQPEVPVEVLGSTTCKMCKIKSGLSRSKFRNDFTSWWKSDKSKDAKQLLAESGSGGLSKSEAFVGSLGDKAWEGYLALDNALNCFGKNDDQSCFNLVESAAASLSRSPIGMAPAVGFLIDFNVGTVKSALGSLDVAGAAMTDAGTRTYDLPTGEKLKRTTSGSVFYVSRLGGKGRFLRNCGDVG